jgi:hypothetical protein
MISRDPQIANAAGSIAGLKTDFSNSQIGTFRKTSTSDYITMGTGTLTGGTIFPFNTLFYVPIYIHGSMTFDRIACRTSGSSGPSGLIRLGIYKNINGRPGQLILDAGTVNVSATNTTYQININRTLSAGWYYLAFVNQGASITIAASVNLITPSSQRTDASLSTISQGGIQTGVTGSLPSVASTSLTTHTNAFLPFVFMRYTS